MNLTNTTTRRRALLVARSGCAVSALAFGLGVAGALTTDVGPAAAAEAGVATIVEPVVVGAGGGDPITSGDGATDFSLALPTGAACTGDTSNEAYYVFGYLIAGGADPNDLEFNSEGPVPLDFEPHADFRAPLYDTGGTAYASAFTAPADPAPGPGPIVNIPTFDLATIIEPDILLPEGDYNLGVACWHAVTTGNTTAVLDKFWNARISVEVDPAAADPTLADVTWSALAAPAATTVTLEADPEDGAAEGDTVTLTATIEPDDAEGTITFRDDGDPLGTAVAIDDGVATFEVDDLDIGEHPLTAAFAPATGADFAPSTSAVLEYTISADGATTTSSTSTTTGGSSTTSSTSTTLGGSGSSTTATTAMTSGGPRSGVGPTSMARTGFSFPMLVWGLLAVVFGRMALLLSRKPKVIAT